MFLAVRDLRFARGRFALMGAVIALISLLVVLLSGLTAGLADQSVSAVRSLPADRLAFSPPADGDTISFSASRVDGEQVRDLLAAAGVEAASPLGVAAARVRTAGHEVAVTAFGADPSGFLAPPGLTPGSVVLSPQLMDDEGLAAGDTVSIGGQRLTVVPATAESSFNHTPVVWLTLTDWQGLDEAAGAEASVVALRTSSSEAISADGVTVVDRGDALSAVGSFTAENGSLTLMRALLLIVSALVVGSFFTVWTIQRTPDLAVLKAIGASGSYLLRDAAVQAFVVLALGGAVGMAVATGAGALAAQVVPFVLGPATTLVPMLSLLAVGMVGALAAVRRITSVDPLTALGAAR